MPTQLIANHRHELNILSDCDPVVFKALVNSKKEIVECLLEILDNVANLRLELDNESLVKLSKKYKFFEKVLAFKSLTAAKAFLLKNIETTQSSIKAALPLINNNDQPV